MTMQFDMGYTIEVLSESLDLGGCGLSVVNNGVLCYRYGTAGNVAVDDINPALP